jgi:AcrR family transcriptional regulator
MSIRERVATAALEAFGHHGIRFTMDDLARRLRMSKRTIYEQVGTKEDVVALVINETFAGRKAQERAILGDPGLDVLTKLRLVLTLAPARADLADPVVITQVREAYPAMYDLIVHHLATGWEDTLALIDRATREGLIRPVRPLVLREILLATTEQMLRDDFLATAGLTHEEALAEVVDIVFRGLETAGPRQPEAGEGVAEHTEAGHRGGRAAGAVAGTRPIQPVVPPVGRPVG